MRNSIVILVLLLSSCSTLKRQKLLGTIVGGILGGEVGKRMGRELSPNTASDKLNQNLGAVLGASAGAYVGAVTGEFLWREHPENKSAQTLLRAGEKARTKIKLLRPKNLGR